MNATYALSRLAGWCWADGAANREGFSVPARRLSARAKHTRNCARALGWTVTRTPPIVGARLKVARPLDSVMPALAAVPNPLAALASVIECEGRTDGLIMDDKYPSRLDECEALLSRILPRDGWKRTSWRDGGGALWVASADALKVVQSCPFVALGRVPQRLPGG
jgi:hypothetical protein